MSEAVEWREALARIEGQLAMLAETMRHGNELLSERMRSGDERAEQLMRLLEQQLTFVDAEIGLVKARLDENRQLAARESNAVRVSLEAKIDPLIERVDSLRLDRARAAGIATAASLIASGLVVSAIKAVGL